MQRNQCIAGCAIPLQCERYPIAFAQKARPTTGRETVAIFCFFQRGADNDDVRFQRVFQFTTLLIKPVF